MPDESCRKCGGVITKCTLCAECKEVISMICTSCGERTLEQFHDYCMYYVENIQTKTGLGFQDVDYAPKILSVI